MFFNIPQIQYKNPWVQIMLFRNMTPSPFLRFYLGEWRAARGSGPSVCPCRSDPPRRHQGKSCSMEKSLSRLQLP